MALTCGNGIDAICTALITLIIKIGDMVFTTNFAFFAIAEIIVELGEVPIFVDTDCIYNICLNDLEYKWNLAISKCCESKELLVLICLGYLTIIRPLAKVLEDFTITNIFTIG